MSAKRKRSEDEVVDFPALTEGNLATLDSTILKSGVDQRRESLSTIISAESGSPSALSQLESQSYSQGDSQSDLALSMALVLETYRIFLDRKQPQPQELAELVQTIKTPRSDLTLTPRSKTVAQRWEYTKNRQEKDSIAALEQLIGYCPEGWGGEQGIDRGQDLPWKASSVPVPEVRDNKTLQQAMAQMGAPKTPIPDICYGYTASSFNQEERDAMSSLEPTCFVAEYATEPILPFIVMEWKARKGSLEEAQQQVRRDGAVAVNTTTNFFKSATGQASLSAEKTAIFSLCVDSNNIELRVHWQHIEENGTVTWEADLVADGMLRYPEHVFRVRSCMLNILAWARGQRLSAVKEALRQRITKLGTVSLPTPLASSPARTVSGRGSMHKRRRI